jgi:hypothetical protein
MFWRKHVWCLINFQLAQQASSHMTFNLLIAQFVVMLGPFFATLWSKLIINPPRIILFIIKISPA